MLRRRSLMSLLAGLALLAAACGDSTGPQGVVGEWRLMSANNGQLPRLVGSYYVHAGQLTIRSDGTYLSARTLGLYATGNTWVSEQTGTYTTAGRSVSLTASPSVIDDALLWRGALMVRVVGDSYRFERR